MLPAQDGHARVYQTATEGGPAAAAAAGFTFKHNQVGVLGGLSQLGGDLQQGLGSTVMGAQES